MACETYEELTNKYVEGLATFAERDRLQAHIEECADCRKDVEELGRVVRILNSLESEEPPRDLMPSLHERLRELQQDHSPSQGSNFLEGIKSIPAILYDLFCRHRRWLTPGIAVLAVAILIFSFPFGLSGYKTATEEAAPQEPQAAMDSGAVYGNKYAEERGTPEMQSLSMAENISMSEMKIIQNASIFVWVEDIQDKVDYTINLAQEHGGYVESTSMSGSGGDYPRSAHIALRVPAQTLTATLDKITALGKLRHKNLSGENITEIYYDTDHRVRNLQKQEERLIEILAMAKNVDEVLRIENELNRVRTDIDQMTGQLKAWDKRVQFSLVEVELREQEPSREKLAAVSWTMLWEHGKQGFIAAVNVVSRFSVKLAEIVGALLPVIALSGIGLAVYLRRKRHKKP